MAVAVKVQDIPEVRVLGGILRKNGVIHTPAGGDDFKEQADKQFKDMASVIAGVKGAEEVRVSGEYEQTHRPPTDNKAHALNETEVKREQGQNADLGKDPNQKMQDEFKKTVEKLLTFGDNHQLDGQKSLNEAWEHLNPQEKKMWGAAAGAVMAWKQGKLVENEAQREEAKKMTIDEIVRGIKEIGTEASRKGEAAIKGDPNLSAAFEECKGVEKAMDAVKAHKAEEKRAERTGEKAAPGRAERQDGWGGMGDAGMKKPDVTPHVAKPVKSEPAIGGH